MYSSAVRTTGQRAGISRDDVVAAALGVLRDEGLDAVTMRRVAGKVGVAPNALYSHVPDKSAMVGALLDAVLADIAVPSGGPWRARIEEILADTRRVLLDFPDLVPLFLARQSVGPNALRLGEGLLEALHEGGVNGPEAALALQALLIHTIGATAFEVPRLRDPDPEGRRRRGNRAVQELDSATHPRTTALGPASVRYPGDAVFALGLRLLLDGLSAAEPGRRAAARRPGSASPCSTPSRPRSS